MDGVTIVNGHARFKAADSVSVIGENLTAPQIFPNDGAHPVIPDFPGDNDIDYLTSTSIRDLDTLPRYLAVIGGSYIGLEFAQMYRRFGSSVTVNERAIHVASREDEDTSEAIRVIL